MEFHEQLKSGNYYHIYNCGINGEDLFRGKEDYERFLRLYEKFIFPVCETYAWVLMKNHFHLLVKVKPNLKYKYSAQDVGYDKDKFNEVKWETVDVSSNADSPLPAELSGLKVGLPCQRPTKVDLTALIPKPHLHFSHFFNAYAKYFNIKYERHGSLFERPFKRKVIEDIKYFRKVVLYIHQNPVHHGFCQHPMEYGWSSYLSIISLKTTLLKRNELLGWFDNVGNFKTRHDETLNRREIEAYLGL